MAKGISALVALLLLILAAHPSDGRICLSLGDSNHHSRKLLAATATLDLTASGSTSGQTPAIIGVNVGHRYPGSNWPLWMQRLGVNGARVFLSSLWGSSLESFIGGSSKWGRSLSGVPVTNLTAFQNAVAELRSPSGHDPSAAGQYSYPVRWSAFDTNWATTSTSSKGDEQEGNHNATLSMLQQLLPNAPVVVIGCGLGSIRDGGVLTTNSSAYWMSHWEVYKHFYAFSRYLWKRGVTRIELYNEPDLDNDFQFANGSFNNALWVDAYTLRSRAIQDLYSDMNREDAIGADLIPNLHVGAYAKTQYNEGKMGQPAVQAMHKTFAAAMDPDPAWFNMQTYSYHSYGQSGKSILSNFQELYTNTTADRATYGSFPFSVTEFNAKTSGDFSTSTLNMDVASQAVKLGSQALNYATAGTALSSMYVFKFSVTLSSGNGVTKNGIHWGDNTGAPYNIADTTLGAEALRLVAEKLSGAKPILALNSANAGTLVDTKAVAVRDGSAYCVHVVNTGTSNVTAALSMASWGVKQGATVIVERVNATHYGEVSEVLSANATGGILLPVYIDNLVRATVVNAIAQSIQAAAAVQVRAGAYRNSNYNSSTTACVGSHPSLHNTTYTTVMKFSVANPSTITRAVLKLTLSSLTASLTENMPMLLLGIRDSSWQPSSVTWTSLVAAGAGPLYAHPPAGSPTTWAMDSVAKNFINYNSGLQVAGHVTLPPLAATKAAGYVKMVDVTPFVKSSNGIASFLLVRPFRRNKEVATGDTMPADTLNSGTSACFHSGTASAASNRPTLLVY